MEYACAEFGMLQLLERRGKSRVDAVRLGGPRGPGWRWEVRVSTMRQGVRGKKPRGAVRVGGAKIFVMSLALADGDPPPATVTDAASCAGAPAVTNTDAERG